MSKFKFCPKCGNNLVSKIIRTHDRLVCSSCGFVFYQNPKPAVGIYILNGDKVLLAKRAIDPFKGYWDSVGGFIEEGESPKETAIRETKEETGLDIEAAEILGAGKDKYGEQDTVVIGFVAKIKSGIPKPSDDVSTLKWFRLNDLPENIAFESNRKALESIKKKFLK